MQYFKKKIFRQDSFVAHTSFFGKYFVIFAHTLHYIFFAFVEEKSKKEKNGGIFLFFVLRFFQKTATKFLDFLFPPECLLCGKEDFFLCPDCRDSIIHETTLQKISSDFLGTLIVMAEYEHPGVSALVKKLKFGHGQRVLEEAHIFFQERAAEIALPKNAVLCPVPLHFLRKNDRGFNQSDLIADILSPLLHAEKKILLRRIRSTPPQSSLHADARKKNIKNAFAVLPNNINRDTPVILIDDVATTGSTLRECASVLRKSGFQKISAIVIARGTWNGPSYG